MLKLEALKNHLQDRGAAARDFAFNKTPLRQNRVVTITEIPGGPGDLDGDLDSPGFQLRCRSEIDEPVQARDDAHLLDRIVMDRANWPANLGGYHAAAAGRAGGPPVFMSRDDEGRDTYVCNYFLKLQR